MPFAEQIGFAGNQLDNELGLFYIIIDQFKVLIPDYFSFAERGWGEALFILERNEEMDIELYHKIIAAQQVLHNQRCQIRTLWTGYQLKCAQREIVAESFQWKFFKNANLSKENQVWNMINDPNFPAYYQSHSAEETAEYYGIAKHQLEHIIYQHQEFRRKDSTQRIRSMIKTKEERHTSDEYAVMDGRMVSQAEMSLVPLLEKFDIKHNDSVNFGGSPVVFGGLGVKSMFPDFVSTDRKVVVEFDGAYFHLDPKEAEFRKMYYDYMGIQCAIIWEGELKNLIDNPPSTLKELLDRFPCTWRYKQLIFVLAFCCKMLYYGITT